MRRNILTALAIMTVAGLTACATMEPIPRNSLPQSTASASEINKAKQGVASQMKDPASVQFKEVRGFKKDEGTLLCGQVNAKNSFGGYTGFKHFTYVGGYLFLNEPAEGCEYCSNPFNKLWNENCN